MGDCGHPVGVETQTEQSDHFCSPIDLILMRNVLGANQRKRGQKRKRKEKKGKWKGEDRYWHFLLLKFSLSGSVYITQYLFITLLGRVGARQSSPSLPCRYKAVHPVRPAFSTPEGLISVSSSAPSFRQRLVWDCEGLVRVIQKIKG